MARITRFETLPKWLQDRLWGDWRELHPETEQEPRIKDAEYRIYEVPGSELYIWDAGTGGISVLWEGGSVAYGEFADDGLRDRVDAAIKQINLEQEVEELSRMLYRRGVDPRVVTQAFNFMADDKQDNLEQRFDTLLSMLFEGIRYGNWPTTIKQKSLVSEVSQESVPMDFDSDNYMSFKVSPPPDVDEKRYDEIDGELEQYADEISHLMEWGDTAHEMATNLRRAADWLERVAARFPQYGINVNID